MSIYELQIQKNYSHYQVVPDFLGLLLNLHIRDHLSHLEVRSALAGLENLVNPVILEDLFLLGSQGLRARQ